MALIAPSVEKNVVANFAVSRTAPAKFQLDGATAGLDTPAAHEEALAVGEPGFLERYPVAPGRGREGGRGCLSYCAKDNTRKAVMDHQTKNPPES
jgi:hypothetical protein